MSEIALDEGSSIKVSVKTRHALLDFINDGRGKLLFGGRVSSSLNNVERLLQHSVEI